MLPSCTAKILQKILLTIQIRHIHAIKINQMQVADANAGQRHRNRRSEAAAAANGHVRRVELVLRGCGMTVEQGRTDFFAADERGRVGLVVESVLAASICACDADGSKVMVVLVFSFSVRALFLPGWLCFVCSCDCYACIVPVVVARNFESGSAALHERDDFQRIGALELRLRTLGTRHDLTIELDSHAVGAQSLAFDQFGHGDRRGDVLFLTVDDHCGSLLRLS